MDNDNDDVSGDGADNDESDVTSTGDHLRMSFMVGDTPVKLELEKNENMPQLQTHYTVENGKLIQWTLDEDQVKVCTLI